MPEKKPVIKTPLKPAEQRRIQELALQYHLVTDEKDGRLKSINNYSKVLAKLQETSLSPDAKIYFNGLNGKPVLLSKDTIGELIEQALKDFKVVVRIDKRRTTSEEFHALVRRLKEKYALKELSVAAPFAGDSDRYPPTPGKQAAALFGDLVQRQGAPPTVGIGGGRTLRQMAFWLHPNEIPLTVTAINYATRIPDNEAYDSSYLAMNVHWLCNQSKAGILSLPPLPTHDFGCAAKWHSRLFKENPDIERHFKEALEPDILFVGTGNFHPDSPSISRVYSCLGIDYASLNRMNPRPVGDINLCFFDKEGNDITSAIVSKHLRKKMKLSEDEFEGGSFFRDQPFCHPFLVGMNIACLKHLVGLDKTVVLVAGGEGTKTEAIHTLLRARIVNALVTDAVTMGNLLRLPESGIV